MGSSTGRSAEVLYTSSAMAGRSRALNRNGTLLRCEVDISTFSKMLQG